MRNIARKGRLPNFLFEVGAKIVYLGWSIWKDTLYTHKHFAELKGKREKREKQFYSEKGPVANFFN